MGRMKLLEQFYHNVNAKSPAYKEAMDELDLHIDNAKVLDNKYCFVSLETCLIARTCIRKEMERADGK